MKCLKTSLVLKHIPPQSFREIWDVNALEFEVSSIFKIQLDMKEFLKSEVTEREIIEELKKLAFNILDNKSELYGKELMEKILKNIFLSSIDQVWKDHLYTLDHLRQGISLRAYGQKDPLNEYKREAFNLFNMMLDNFSDNLVRNGIQFQVDPEFLDPEKIENFRNRYQKMIESREDPAFAEYNGGKSVSTKPKTYVNHVDPEKRNPNDPTTWGKVSRNEVCPCRSGKKYKHCHGVYS